MDIATLRLINQRIASADFTSPCECVSWFGAVQAQDYSGALWAVGLRMKDAVGADIERALADRSIVRTWPMRRTLHFVAADDVRWMLALLAPRAVAGMAKRLRDYYGLDEETLSHSRRVIERALHDGNQLTRPELYKTLDAEGVSIGDQRGMHIVTTLAQKGVICFGARQSKQQTIVLLDEWVPPARSLSREEAMAKLAARYFSSHGPATIHDFAWWSGLTIKDSSAGLNSVKSQFVSESIDGRTYWFLPSNATEMPKRAAHLLPPYDEYTVAYRDRSAAVDPEFTSHANYGYGIFNPTIVLDGKIVGTWKRSVLGGSIEIHVEPFRKLDRLEQIAIGAAWERLRAFLGISVRSSSSLRSE